MAETITIKEKGTPRNFTVDKIRTNKAAGGTVDWGIGAGRLGPLVATWNKHTYRPDPELDGIDGYSEVQVDIQALDIGVGLAGWAEGQSF